MNPVPFPSNLENDELRRWLRWLESRIDGATTTVLYSATLAADLNSGDTVALGGKTYDGSAIRAGYKFASGTVVYAAYDGTNYKIIGANACEVAQ